MYLATGHTDRGLQEVRPARAGDQGDAGHRVHALHQVLLHHAALPLPEEVPPRVRVGQGRQGTLHIWRLMFIHFLLFLTPSPALSLSLSRNLSPHSSAIG